MNQAVPIKPLWLREGRVLLSKREYKIKTFAGIEVEDFKDSTVRTAIVLEVSENLSDVLKPGDHVMFNMIVGNALKLNFASAEINVIMHAMDIIALWTVDPKEYYENQSEQKPDSIVN